MLPRYGFAKTIHSNLRKVTDISKATKNAANYSSTFKDKPLKSHQLLEIGLSYLEEGKDIQIVTPIFEDALNKSTTDTPTAVMIECHYGIGVNSDQLKKIRDDKDKYDKKSLKHFEHALELCEKISAQREEFLRLKSKILRNRGLNYLSKGEFELAEKDFKESLDLAKLSPENLKGFIPAVTAYYALILGKQKKYEESFAQFSIAEKLYAEFSPEDLEVSMDYASFFVHQGRIYLQQEKYQEAEIVLKTGYELRVKNLKVTDPNENYYAADRIDAVATLLEEARAGLKNQQEKKESPLITTLRNSGSPSTANRSIRKIPSIIITPEVVNQGPRK